MNRISACLITLNEEANLARALASLSGVADEIVVIDSGSSDRTEEIAREKAAVVITEGILHSPSEMFRFNNPFFKSSLTGE